MTQPSTPDSTRRRWLALAVVSIAQLMIVLDGSVVNVALPRAQVELGFDDSLRQWVVTAYSLAFGALLLLGGRLSDVWGRKRAFLIGLIGFGAASVLGGAAGGIGVLLLARALQGVFAALLAPAALSLLSTTFTAGRERAKAFGVFSAVAGAGGAIGLLLGGVLTEYSSWRWTLLVNVFFAVVAVVGAVFFLRDAGDRGRQRVDIVGTLLASVGLAALVYTFTLAEEDGWTSWLTLGVAGVAVIALIAFVFTQTRASHPLLPLRVVTDRHRGGSYLSIALGMAANFAQFLLLTYYLQQVLGFSPLATGLGFLPLVIALVLGTSQIGSRLATRFPVRWVMGAGYAVAAIGLAWLTRVTSGDDYWTVVVPATVVMGLGLGAALIAGMTTATHGVAAHDAGIASAMVNSSQQIGGSVGTALTSAIAASVTAALVVPGGGTSVAATVEGYSAAFWVASGLLLAAAIAAVLVVPSRRGSENTAPSGAEAVAVHA